MGWGDGVGGRGSDALLRQLPVFWQRDGHNLIQQVRINVREYSHYILIKNNYKHRYEVVCRWLEREDDYPTSLNMYIVYMYTLSYTLFCYFVIRNNTFYLWTQQAVLWLCNCSHPSIILPYVPLSYDCAHPSIVSPYVPLSYDCAHPSIVLPYVPLSYDCAHPSIVLPYVPLSYDCAHPSIVLPYVPLLWLCSLQHRLTIRTIILWLCSPTIVLPYIPLSYDCACMCYSAVVHLPKCFPTTPPPFSFLSLFLCQGK